MVEAIFFDIDGTLVSFKSHQISQSTFETLYQLKEKGIRLFIATGRGKDGLDVLQQFPFDGYITLNGQYCYTNDGSVIYENTILKSELTKIVSLQKDHPFPCGFVKEHTKVFNYRDERVDKIHEITHNDNHPSGDISNIENEKVYQIMAFLNPEEEVEVMAQLPHCTSARWHESFCDISPIGGTKVKGIDTFLSYYNIPLDHVMAFGDGGNDIEMLGHVPYSIAMANGNEKLKEIAWDVTDDVDHDGITKACKKHGLI